MYRFFIEQTEVFDVDIEPSLTIIREDGFGNDEQILREKSDTQLRFFCDAYNLICQLRQNYCDSFVVTILYDNELFYIGRVEQKELEIDIEKKIMLLNGIKDLSFSSLLALYKDVDIDTFNTKTLNCEDIVMQKKTLQLNVVPFPAVAVLNENKYSFDVLDVIKYIVGYITDNQLQVVSNYLTNNLYHICYGYALHNTTGSIDKLYPKLSLGTILNELRKKTTIYTILEQSPLGVQTLRIEDENYSYGTQEILRIDKIPKDFKETFDDNNIYNQINVGSSITESEDTIIVPQKRLVAWNKESYLGCGCKGNKDSELDLVSDWIIDANVFYEAIKTPIGDDYNNDDAIFLLRVMPTNNAGIYKMFGGGNELLYNQEINNENVLNRWLGIANSCLVTLRNSKYGFDINTDLDVAVSIDTWGTGIAFTSDRDNIVRYNNPPDIIYDNENSIFDEPTPPDAFTYFLCQQNGTYSFLASSVFKQIPSGSPAGDTDVIGADLYLSIEVWSGIGGVQLAYDEFVEFSTPNLNTNEIPMSLQSTFNLATGNIVFVRYRMVYSEVGPKQWYINAENNAFSLISDSFGCDNITDNTDNFKPFLGKFKYPLCYNDYKLLRENKNGIIKINNVNTWIKEIKYTPNKLAEFTVKYKNTIC